MAKAKKISTEPILEEKKAPVKKEAPKKEVVKTPDVSAVEQAKKELMEEMAQEGDVKKIKFVKSIVPNSQATADLLNKRPYKIAVWEAEDGEKAGTAEPVRVNGAVAMIPKGVPVYVPDVVAEDFKRYLRVEKTVGNDIPNSRGGVGIRAEDDASLKNALDL